MLAAAWQVDPTDPEAIARPGRPWPIRPARPPRRSGRQAAAERFGWAAEAARPPRALRYPAGSRSPARRPALPGLRRGGTASLRLSHGPTFVPACPPFLRPPPGRRQQPTGWRGCAPSRWPCCWQRRRGNRPACAGRRGADLRRRLPLRRACSRPAAAGLAHRRTAGGTADPRRRHPRGRDDGAAAARSGRRNRRRRCCKRCCWRCWQAGGADRCPLSRPQALPAAASLPVLLAGAPAAAELFLRRWPPPPPPNAAAAAPGGDRWCSGRGRSDGGCAACPCSAPWPRPRPCWTACRPAERPALIVLVDPGLAGDALTPLVDAAARTASRCGARRIRPSAADSLDTPPPGRR